jgi:hypothetical protein
MEVYYPGVEDGIDCEEVELIGLKPKGRAIFFPALKDRAIPFASTSLLRFSFASQADFSLRYRSVRNDKKE